MDEVIEISVSDTAVKSTFDQLVANDVMHGWKVKDIATAERFNLNNMALIMLIMSSHFTLDKQSQLSNQLISDINNALEQLNGVVAGKALASDVSTSINLINQQFVDLRSQLDQITALAQGNASGIAKMLGEMATDDEVLAALNAAIGNHYTKNEIVELLRQYQLNSVGVAKDDPRLSDSRIASDVYAWAKAATKPTYTASEVGAANSVHAHTDSLVFDAAANTITFTKTDGTTQSISLAKYLDNNTAALASASYDAVNKRLVFTREDSTNFYVDVSVFFDDTNLVMSVNGKTGAITLTPADIGAAAASHNHSGVYEPVITKKTAFNVDFGTAAGTACQGNDSRLSNSRPASDVSAWAKAATKPTYTAAETGAANAVHAHADSLVFDAAANTITFTKTDGTTQSISLAKYLDNNTAALASASYDAVNKRLVFTREDSTNFYVDVSVFFDDTNLVMSVNGKTGAITLTPADIGAAAASHNHSGVYEPVITKKTAFNVDFGTAAGTACQGNDSRLSNSRPASDVSAWAKAATKPTYTAAETGAANAVHAHADSLVFDAAANTITFTKTDGTTQSISLAKYLDNNTAALASASYDAVNKRLVFTREDSTNFYVDVSVFFDDTNLVMSVNGKTGAITLTPADIGAMPANTFIPAIYTGATVDNTKGVNGDLFLVV